MNNRYIFYEDTNTFTGDTEWVVVDQEKATGTVAWCISEGKAKQVAIAMNLLDTFKKDLR